MTQMVNGKVCGFFWYEVPRAAAGYYEKQIPEHITHITAVTGKAFEPRKMQMLLTAPRSTNFFTPVLPFRPFDPEAELPERYVMYERYGFEDEKITTWTNEHLNIPDELELSFSMDSIRGNMHVSAMTEKNGRLIKIRRKLDTSFLLKDALDQHLPYFLKNCRKPTGKVPEFVCGEHVATLLSNLTRKGVDLVQNWLAKWQNAQTNHGNNVMALVLPGEMLPGAHVNRVELDKLPNTNLIKATVHVEGGHVFTDDPTGVTAVLRTQLPDTVLTSLKSRSFGDVIDIEWARPLNIRLARDHANGETTIRAYSSTTPLLLPEPKPLTREEAIRQIFCTTFEDSPPWTISEAAMPTLAGLDLESLATVLALLRKAHQQVDLDQFGRPGWTLRTRGLEIIVEACPAVSLDAFLRTLTNAPAGAVQNEAGL